MDKFIGQSMDIEQTDRDKQKNLLPTLWQGRNLIHFAAQKNHLGIYPGEATMKHFTLRLNEHKTRKGAI